MIRLATLLLFRPFKRRDAAATLDTVCADVLVAVAVVLLATVFGHAAAGALAPIGPYGIPAEISLDTTLLSAYAVRSALRMLVGLAFSLVFALVYGLACARCGRLGRWLIVLLDVLQSVPVLGFLSATVTVWLALFPGSMLGAEAASIFAIFTSQAWNMALAFYQSLASEPAELDEMARSFRFTRWQRFWRLDVPFGMQQLVWNAMMSMGGAWFFLGASELISVNGRTMALPGVGSFAALAAEHGHMDLVGYAAATMALVVLAMDLLLWRPLMAWSEGLQGAAPRGRGSAVLNALRVSRSAGLIACPGRLVASALARPMGWLLGRTGADPRWKRVVSAPLRRMRGLASGGLLASGRACLRARRHVTAVCAAVLVVGAVSLAAAPLIRGVGPKICLATALGALTFLRVAVVTALCSLVWVPVGVLIGLNARARRAAQPVIQLVASFPASLLFPMLVAAMSSCGIDLGIGSLLLMALGSQWYILFNVVAAASAIPPELCELADIMRMPVRQRWLQVYLPAVAGPWVAGALATAGGVWNASVVAEVVGAGSHMVTTPGLGSYIAAATASGDAVNAAVGIAVMCAFVIAANMLVWRPLQRLAAQRFTLS